MRPGPELFYPRKRRNPTMSDEKRCTCEEDASNLGSPPCAKCFAPQEDSGGRCPRCKTAMGPVQHFCNPTHGEGGGEKPDTSGVVERLREVFGKRISGKHRTYGPLENAINDALAHIEAQAKEIERLKQALHLGGHLRPNGTLCDYLAPGTVCNKCGATDRAYHVHVERDALLEGMREIWDRTAAMSEMPSTLARDLHRIASRHIEGAGE